ncbi:MAG: 50S ribosomal protein L25 [Kiritimatiellia bacterium]
MGTVDSIVLRAEARRAAGSGEARRVRAEGKVPVVVYGEGRNDSLQVDAHAFTLMMQRHGEHQILDLEVDGKAAGKVLVKDVQHDVCYGNILHADLVAVSMDKPISLRLPLKVEGEAAGMKLGGILELVISEIEIECLPGDMVEDIPVDVTALQIGDNLKAGQLALPKGLALLEDPEEVVLTIAAPLVEQEETAEGEDAVAAAAAK